MEKSVLNVNIVKNVFNAMPVNDTYSKVARYYSKLAIKQHWSIGNENFPINMRSFKQYLSYESQRVMKGEITSGTLYSYLSALGSYHRANGWPWDHLRFNEFTKHALSVVKSRAPQHTISQGYPISYQDMVSLVNWNNDAILDILVFKVIALSLWSGVARVSDLLRSSKENDFELASIRRKDVSVHLVPKSASKFPGRKLYSIALRKTKVKTAVQQYVVVNAAHPPLDAALLMECLLSKNSKEYLFTVRNNKIASREWFNFMLSSALSGKIISGSSFRAGAASHLAMNGTSLEVIKRLGRWSSDAFELYVRNHPDLLLSALNYNNASSLV